VKLPEKQPMKIFDILFLSPKTRGEFFWAAQFGDSSIHSFLIVE
jgi:hypothetical protein